MPVVVVVVVVEETKNMEVAEVHMDVEREIVVGKDIVVDLDRAAVLDIVVD